MIVALALWILVFLIFTSVGFLITDLIKKISGDHNADMGPDVMFFSGFVTLSILTGYLSILMPVGFKVLIIIVLITITICIFRFRDILYVFRKVRSGFSELNKTEIILIGFLFFYLLATVAYAITWGDTESYHCQSIQWIRKYAVVPGLGNIHGRLAFNSMFFTISGLFFFQIKNILIFPLNGISFIVFSGKVISIFLHEFRSGEKWKALFYALLFLFSFLMLIPNINSPSPDVICTILILYFMAILFERITGVGKDNMVSCIVLTSLVFVTVTFKISSVFLVLFLTFFISKHNVLKKLLLIAFIGTVVLLPFLIRNYYLSGYLIYPFPGIDIFNVDWKIPVGKVIDDKMWIQSWARIPGMPWNEVMKMKVTEWIIPWFRQMGFNDKLIVAVNIISVFSCLLMFLKRDLKLALFQFTLLVCLSYWFIMAPDTRFAYGFLITGFSLLFAYSIKLLENSAFSPVRFLNIGLIIILVLILGIRITLPAATVIEPSRWIIPAPFGTVPANEYSNTGFKYRVPVPEGGCFNVDIPCVPYPLENIVLRGEDIQQGFKPVQH